MKIRATLTCLFALIFALPASAAPTKLAQQGRVLDGAGAPLEGDHEMIFVLYDAATDGAELWTEERSADFEAGYYSITLGEQVPLDDLLFTADSVWLELSIDGETLAPRQEVVSVPYALRATAAEHVEGGLVDAEEISVDGAVVIDASGNWVGPTPAVGWGDLSDVPADIADGDQDTDTLAGLACAEGQLPKWDTANGVWVCGDDIDTTDPNTDVLAGLPCADGYIAKYDGASGLWNCALDADSFADLAGVCLPGDIPVLDPVSGGWICGMDTDTVTSSLPWSAITGIPADLADGDQDTQLTEAQVDAMADNNGYSTGAHTVDTDTQLTDAQVASAALAEGFVTGAHTVDTDTQLTDAQVASAALAEGFVTGAHTSSLAWSEIVGIPADLADGDQDTQITTVPWNMLTGVPAGLSDGDQDTQLSSVPWSMLTGIPADLADGDQDTQLTDAQVAAAATAEGFVTGAHTVDTDTHLTDSEVAAIVSAAGYVLAGSLHGVATSGDYSALAGTPWTELSTSLDHTGTTRIMGPNGAFNVAMGAETSPEFDVTSAVGPASDNKGFVSVGSTAGDALATMFISNGEAGAATLDGANGHLNAAIWHYLNSPDHGVVQLYDDTGSATAHLYASETGGGTLWTIGPNGSSNALLTAYDANPDQGALLLYDDDGDIQARLDLVNDETGSLKLNGPNGKYNFGLWSYGTSPDEGALQIYDANEETRVRLDLDGSAGRVWTHGPNGSSNVLMGRLGGFPDHGALLIGDSAGSSKVGMYVNSSGDGLIYADIKNFRTDHPYDPSSEIWYACVEGPEAAAYARGTDQLVHGSAEVVLPEHFEVLVAEGTMTVSVTPLSADSDGLAVVDKGPSGFSVRELRRGKGTYGFDWEVKAVRKGYEDYEVVRPKRNELAMEILPEETQSSAEDPHPVP